MPQVLKDAVRNRIIQASREAFAQSGYEGATMPQIAARAGVAAAGVYRYFSSKAELFAQAVPTNVAGELDRLLMRRIDTLTHLVGQMPDPRAESAATELLSFWIEHRFETIILLEKAQGTPYAGWGDRFVRRLVVRTTQELKSAHPRLKLNAPTKLVLKTLFENTRRMLATILETEYGEASVREAIGAFWSYQLAGLAGFSAWVGAASAPLAKPTDDMEHVIERRSSPGPANATR